MSWNTARPKTAVELSMLLWVVFFNYLSINLPGKSPMALEQRIIEMICSISNVVEKCVTHASRDERRQLIDEIISFGDGYADERDEVQHNASHLSLLCLLVLTVLC